MPATEASEFGIELRRQRRRERLSQTALAKLADIHASYVNRLESGDRRPADYVVLKLADALRASLQERNRLLLAAGFAPVLLDQPQEDETLAAVAEVLNDPKASDDDRRMIQQVVEGIKASWRQKAAQDHLSGHSEQQRRLFRAGKPGSCRTRPLRLSSQEQEAAPVVSRERKGGAMLFSDTFPARGGIPEDLPNRGLLMLELSDILWRCVHRPDSIQRSDRSLLHAGADFLNKARKGARILYGPDGAPAVPDTESISAYRFASYALQSAEPEEHLPSSLAETTFARFESALIRLANQEPISEQFGTSVYQAQSFFERLSVAALFNVAPAR
jgi:transcriptional regulator with XRE-family HTH domain